MRSTLLALGLLALTLPALGEDAMEGPVYDLVIRGSGWVG